MQQRQDCICMKIGLPNLQHVKSSSILWENHRHPQENNLRHYFHANAVLTPVLVPKSGTCQITVLICIAAADLQPQVVLKLAFGTFSWITCYYNKTLVSVTIGFSGQGASPSLSKDHFV